ncbi:hypothetical protein HRR83_008212 [Exophiala dermatitidis]|uniref:Uncharacterized protein n=1 Tax=Exophiala dermatitidis TaxID=5970 RepID=A0AAN6ISL7_EXODE|nr:hypothetical protein HRR74_007833 [Exophiala dermatitidis]KAJ4513641.1 hypothetical protein HRR73_005799 [Exophiala dermatitidis]KAJ4535511.1 hypothetical protein HRR77_007832 [Exophiala dermatitidis]KAJ4544438.1 hypothetical protein HRR76_002497 [Exophiala dermatitidis]KAJ4557035.1 hypothetical protein HRR79_008669 [Exophiala dermatitidis]
MMRFSASAVATAALMAGAAIAEPLATITPCPALTTSTIPPITVTEQYQSVSTCAPTSACFRGSCVTKYALETFAYVNTVIPCAWDGESESTTTVTATQQEVTVSVYHTTITKTVTPTVSVTKNGTIYLVPSPTPIELTIGKEFKAPFNHIGPLAIPGYGGSGLCEECKVQADGSRSQVVDVVECRAGPGGSKCMGYAETWISKPAPSVSSTTVAPVSTNFVAPSAGTYTFTFTLTAPSRVITVDTETITVAPSPFFAHVTRACHRPHQTIDFTTTITKTIYWTVPCSRQPPKTSSAVPFPTGHFPWFPKPTGANNAVGGNGGQGFDWADWGSDDVTNPTVTLPGQWNDWVTETKTLELVGRGH